MSDEQHKSKKKNDDSQPFLFGIDSNQKNYYVDPQHLRDLIRDYKNESKTNPNCVMSDELGKVLLKMATRFVSKPCFSGYSYKEDMIIFAVSKMIAAVEHIDPDDPRSPFGYLTQTCFRSVIQYIKKEKQYEKTKDSVRDKVYNELASEYGLKEVHNPNYENNDNESSRVILKEEDSFDDQNSK